MSQDDTINQPTTEEAFLKAVEERQQLESDIKVLLKELEEKNPSGIEEIADRLKILMLRRDKLLAS